MAKVNLKLFVDPTGKKVLFAEAGKEFVDFLFTILSLPVGGVVKILGAEKMDGCLGSLYKSIENLDVEYMQQFWIKEHVLAPYAHDYGVRVSLLPENVLSTERKFYMCANSKSTEKDDAGCCNYVADDPRCICWSCQRPVSSVRSHVTPSPYKDDGGYVKRGGAYIVMDDLVVRPMSTTLIVTLINQFNVKDLESCEQKVQVGVEQGMELLRVSLRSKTVLTDVLLPKI